MARANFLFLYLHLQYLRKLSGYSCFPYVQSRIFHSINLFTVRHDLKTVFHLLNQQEMSESAEMSPRVLYFFHL